MADDILFVGLDVHKKTISVATVLERPGESCRYYGSIGHVPGRGVAEGGHQRFSGKVGLCPPT